MQTHNGQHPRRRKAAKRARRKIKPITGPLLREVKRKLKLDRQESYAEDLALFERVLGQKRQDKNKIYSLHEPHVACIAKGKVHPQYEFGSKVSVVRCARSGAIVGMKNFKGNPYDGHTLADTLKQCEQVRRDASGNRPKRAVTD